MEYKKGDYVIFNDPTYGDGKRLVVGRLYKVARYEHKPSPFLSLEGAPGVYAKRVIPAGNLSELEKLIYGVN